MPELNHRDIVVLCTFKGEKIYLLAVSKKQQIPQCYPEVPLK